MGQVGGRGGGGVRGVRDTITKPTRYEEAQANDSTIRTDHNLQQIASILKVPFLGVVQETGLCRPNPGSMSYFFGGS